MAQPKKKKSEAKDDGEVKQPRLTYTAIGATGQDDLLMCMPESYLDYTAPIKNITMFMGQRVFVHVEVYQTSVDFSRKPARFNARVRNTSNPNEIMILNSFGKPVCEQGEQVFISGVVSEWKDWVTLENVERVDPSHIGKIVPRYAAKKGATSFAISYNMDVAFSRFMRANVEALERRMGMPADDVLKRFLSRFNSIEEFFSEIHRPRSIPSALDAMEDAKRMASHYVLSLAKVVRKPNPSSALKIAPDHVAKLAAALPYPLTNDQKNAIRAIWRSLCSEYPTRHLINGDVGVGKTNAALLPILAARNHGYRVAVLMPNSLLVEQVCNQIRDTYPEIPCVSVTGGGEAKSKAKALDLSENPVVVGTTAILSDKWMSLNKFEPHVVWCDEQAKYSRGQREALLLSHTNLIESTATAIPRTAALVAYGGMDISIIRECPVQKHIVSSIVFEKDKAELFAKIKRTISAGGQVAVVYPLVESDSEEKQLKTVESAGVMWEKIYPGRVAVLHGRHDEDHKRDVIARLKSGELSMLVSSLVIELGLTLPDLMGLAVVHPERYGVAQLHQLRGRVARGGGEGWFAMYCPQFVKEQTFQRLQLVRDHNDGFTLAEYDMKMRGFGDLSAASDQQSGASPTLFPGLLLMPDDIDQAASSAV